MHLPIIYSFARSGGTLVNQLLGVHPDCLILSEINPAASVIPVTKQAADWLGLIEAGEIVQFQEFSYAKQIFILNERAKSKGNMLIIRDWVTVNFLPGAGGISVVPSAILEQHIYLEQVGCSLQPLVITRKANSVYQSIRRNFMHLSNLTADDFLSVYLDYARAVCNFPKVSLEALQFAPRETLIQILRGLGISTSYVDQQLLTFSNFTRCTGNNTLAVPSETTHARHIVPVGSRSETDNVSINREAGFMEVDHLLGYSA